MEAVAIIATLRLRPPPSTLMEITIVGDAGANRARALALATALRGVMQTRRRRIGCTIVCTSGTGAIAVTRRGRRIRRIHSTTVVTAAMIGQTETTLQTPP